MKKLLIVVLSITTFLFAIDFTFTKAWHNFTKGMKIVNQNPQEAQIYFKKSYNLIQKIKDRPSSQVYYMLGRMYCNGWGVEKDLSKAEIYFKKALSLGNKRVNCCLARLYIKMGKKELAKKYLNIALNHPNLKIYCTDINPSNLTIKDK